MSAVGERWHRLRSHSIKDTPTVTYRTLFPFVGSWMITVEQVTELAEEIAANWRVLKNCSGHFFTIDLTPGLPFRKRFRCTACGGEVSGQAKWWYEAGLSHGGQ